MHEIHARGLALTAMAASGPRRHSFIWKVIQKVVQKVIQMPYRLYSAPPPWICLEAPRAPSGTWLASDSPRIQPDRSHKWVKNCRRADLENKTPNQVHKHYRLCAKHFETSMICTTNPYKTVLGDNATPMIFDLTSHLYNLHSRHRKQKN
ncbi:hypothetical protein QTO34_016299 [Cnephaeus nilssonii]|uniref:THAP-type domain-containing protein n=1 Tax=Cnephaeus nilssonii TaxID=3371016 RepID=A0AA40I5T9_CNENI|nr:hypothetical protein QTO34_016299 [Eptesicus nilssonii]